MTANDDACRRLMTIPGIGVITSSAIVASIGTGGGFKQGRDFAAWLGLVPRQLTTGGRTKLAGLSKRGNCYLRTLFVQAAHVILVKKPAAAQAALWPWIERAAKRMAHRRSRSQRRSRTSSPASPGPFWLVDMTIGRSLTPGTRKMKLGFTTGMIMTILLRHLRSPVGLSERRWLRRDGFT